jgi:hypothetical protein
VSELPLVRVHVVSWTEDGWDVERSLFSLAAQEDVRLSVHLHGSADVLRQGEQIWARLAPLGASVQLSTDGVDRGPWAPGDAVAIWIAGTVATPDHFRVAFTALPGKPFVIGTVRRVEERRLSGAAPYVVRKRRREIRSVRLETVLEDPAFLGRCLFPSSELPDRIPLTPEDHRRWATRAWGAGPPRLLPEPPLVDIPDLRPSTASSLRDLVAELDYQIPRWLERRIPVTFTLGQRWTGRLRRLPGRALRLLGRRPTPPTGAPER